MSELAESKVVGGSEQTESATARAVPGARSARPDAAQLPALIPIPVAAALLGLSRASAYRYAAAGELPTKRFGRRIYVITNRIRELLAEPMSEEVA